MQIGIFGGTFNPIHLGHLIVAEIIREQHKIDKIYFVPSAIPPHKESPILQGYHRLNMVNLAIHSNPYFSASSLEVDRGGKSYTIDTIQQVMEELGIHHTFYFIIGADAFRQIKTWKDYKRLLKLCKFFVLSRPSVDLKIIHQELSSIFFELNLLSKEVKKDWDYDEIDQGRYDIFFLQVPQIDISSTQIRELVMAGKSIRYQVTESVEEYIKMNRLYIK